MSAGVISGWEAELFTCGVLTGLAALLLWRPLKQFQNSGGGPDTSSDMIGQQVPVSTAVTHAVGGTIRHSGINWNARLSNGAAVESIAVGEICVIVGVEGNVMLVEPFGK
ncbi:NfeD family protein [Oceanicoccus sp. KOV_DT_Chl]|uniref:NfeD family protein n=1 Tax=Oceanicoccus sp. KOV_DT_Chl TaxID=1904639 RepID=UPI001F1BC71D|nr:NfeD family protein [Oceanicoccus sp. KOV_DT_Chl]